MEEREEATTARRAELQLLQQLDKEEIKGKRKRGRVELRRIEDRVSRQVLFSKHRAGLFKKAFELSLLCDADVALLVFSPAGKLYEYASARFIFVPWSPASIPPRPDDVRMLPNPTNLFFSRV